MMVGHVYDGWLVLACRLWGRSPSCPVLGGRHSLTSNVLRSVWWLRFRSKCRCVWWALNSLRWHQLERTSDLVQISLLVA